MRASPRAVGCPGRSYHVVRRGCQRLRREAETYGCSLGGGGSPYSGPGSAFAISDVARPSSLMIVQVGCCVCNHFGLWQLWRGL